MISNKNLSILFIIIIIIYLFILDNNKNQHNNYLKQMIYKQEKKLLRLKEKVDKQYKINSETFKQEDDKNKLIKTMISKSSSSKRLQKPVIIKPPEMKPVVKQIIKPQPNIKPDNTKPNKHRKHKNITIINYPDNPYYYPVYQSSIDPIYMLNDVPTYTEIPEPVYQQSDDQVYQSTVDPTYQPSVEPIYKQPTVPTYQPSIDPVYIRDNQVINDALYPPLARTERPTFDLLMKNINNPLFNQYTRGPPDTYRLLGYLTSIDSNNQEILELYGRAKYQNSDIGEFYVIKSSNNNRDIKIPLTNNNSNVKKITDIPNEINITGKIYNGNYNFTELPKPDLSYPYI